MKQLLIDDIRTLPDTVIARTFEEGMEQIRDHGPWDVLYLDHDLGDPDPKKTGYDVLNWLEEFPSYLPGKIVLVTSNPVGRLRMNVVIERLYRGYT